MTADPHEDDRLIQLPRADAGQLSKTIGSCLRDRRSIRDLQREATVGQDHIGLLLWAAQGARADASRTTPSAGGVHPIHLQLLTGSVAGLEPGAYRYAPDGHTLQQTQDGEVLHAAAATALDPSPWMGDASCIVVVSIDQASLASHFDDQPPRRVRSLRYGHIEAGTALQNMMLAAASLSLATTIVGGFHDDALRATLRLRERVHPVALLTVGLPTA